MPMTAMNSYTRLYSPDTDLDALLRETDAGSAVTHLWSPTQFTPMQGRCAVEAKLPAWKGEIVFSIEDNSGFATIVGGQFNGSWTVIEARDFSHNALLPHSFNELYRVKATNTKGAVMHALVGRDLIMRAPHAEATL
jgi:hypothetical protein